MGSIKNHIILNKKQSFLHYENEFSHIYRRKSICELIRLSMAVMGIEFTYAALTAFVSPVLLELGVKFNHMSLVWGISPIIGFFLSPMMGTLSDGCRLKFGRRRPFIILLGIFNVVGLLLIPYGQWLATAVKNVIPVQFEDTVVTTSVPSTSTNSLAILVTIIGIVIADYTSDALQNPCRAYLLDVCRPDDHARGLTTFTVLAGSGGFIGYLLGSIDWKFIQNFDFSIHNGIFGGHIQVFYTITAIIFTFCIAMSITTFKEVPLKVTEYIRIETGMLSESDFYQKELEEVAPIRLKPKSYGSESKEQNCDEPQQNLTPSPMNYLKSIIHMPKSIRILCLTNLFCWMAHASYSLYFTEFVGNVVFQGEPNAAAGSKSKTLYEDGVRFGCFGLAIYSLSCMLYSFAVESLVKRFGLKRIFMMGILIDSVSLLLMAILRNKIAIIILSASCGIFYATLFTVPYILVAHYHATNVFELDSCGDIVPQKLIRGIGTDISVIGCCVFIAQFLLSLFMGLITKFITSSTVVMMTGSVLALCAFFVSTKVMYLDM